MEIGVWRHEVQRMEHWQVWIPRLTSVVVVTIREATIWFERVW